MPSRFAAPGGRDRIESASLSSFFTSFDIRGEGNGDRRKGQKEVGAGVRKQFLRLPSPSPGPLILNVYKHQQHSPIRIFRSAFTSSNNLLSGTTHYTNCGYFLISCESIQPLHNIPQDAVPSGNTLFRLLALPPL